jgi:hypothetical protein
MLVCKVCQKEFVYAGPKGTSYQAVTCSKECRSRLVGIRNSQNRIHPHVISSCQVCGKEVINSITCSRECHGQRLSKLYAGRKITDEWKKKQNEAKKKENIIKYGNFICEKCQKVFETNTSLRAHKSYCTPKENIINVTCEDCGKIFKTERGLKIHEKCHNQQWNMTRVEKIRERARSRKTQSTSKSEIAFYKRLTDFFGESDVIHKFKFDGCSHEYDFFILSKKIIVEFDGDYWHGNKRLYTLTSRMKKQFYIDRSWGEKAIRAGYNIKRIWESESKEFQMETL